MYSTQNRVKISDAQSDIKPSKLSIALETVMNLHLVLMMVLFMKTLKMLELVQLIEDMLKLEKK